MRWLKSTAGENKDRIISIENEGEFIEFISPPIGCLSDMMRVEVMYINEDKSGKR